MLRYVVACLFASAWLAAPSAARAQDKIPLSGAVAETDTPDSKRPSLFDEVEPVVTASPSSPVSIALPAATVVVDFEVSPLGDEVGLVTEDKTHHQQIAFWRFSARELGRTIDVPADTRVASLTWQPKGRSLFLLAGRGAKSVILSLDPAATAFAPAMLLSSEKPLRRLVVGPRPFEVTDNQPAFRLFFGEKQPDGSYQLRTVADDGKQIYTVIGPKKDPMHKEDEEGPNTAIAPSALPVGFHPAGNRLIWEDNAQCLHRLGYELDNWGKIEPFGHGCGHIEAYTPNGAATLEWAPKVPGIRLRGLFDKSDRVVLSEFILVSVPSQAPDGRGVVAVTADAGVSTLRYLPIDAPLAEVANAWMYLAHADDQKRFVEDRGLFRSLAQDEQLYQLYDSEFDHSVPGGSTALLLTWPDHVMTDLLWELHPARRRTLHRVGTRSGDAGLRAFRPWRG